MNRISSLVRSGRKSLGPLGWGALVVFIINRGGDLSNLVCKVFLGKVLKPIDFGAIDPVISAIALMSLPVTIVFQVGVRSISRLRASGKHAECRALIRDMLKVAFAGSVAVVLGLYILRHDVMLRLHLDARYLPVVASLFGLAWWTPMCTAILQGGRHYRAMAIPTIARPFLILVLTVLLVGSAGMGLNGALYARVAGNILAIVVVFVLLRSVLSGVRLRYSEEISFIKELFLPMTLFMGSLALMLHFDKLFVRNFMVEDSGGFSAVVTLGVIPMFFVGPVVFVLFPLVAAEHAGGRSIRRFVVQAVAIGSATSVSSVLILGFFSRQLMMLWDKAFVPYAEYVWIYALAMGLQAIIKIIGTVELARHRYGFLWFLAIPAVAMCAGMYFLEKRLSFEDVFQFVLWGRVIALAGIVTSVLVSEKTRRETGR